MFYTCVLIFDIIKGDHATFRSTWTPPQVFIYEPINTFELCWYYCEFFTMQCPLPILYYEYCLFIFVFGIYVLFFLTCMYLNNALLLPSCIWESIGTFILTFLLFKVFTAFSFHFNYQIHSYFPDRNSIFPLPFNMTHLHYFFY